MKRYTFHPVMLLRSPAYPFSHIRESSLQVHLDCPYFQNALFIAAPQFYSELEKCNFQLAKIKPKAVKAIRNYLNRLFYRSTPFGLFSGFGLVRWQQKGEPLQEVIIQNRQLQVIPEIVGNIMQSSPSNLLIDSLLLFSNPSVYKMENAIRYLKSEYDINKRRYQFQVSEMDYHEMTELVLSYCNTPMSLGDLKKEFSEKSNIKIEELLHFITHLLEQDLLLSKTEFTLLHQEMSNRSILPESRLCDPDLIEEVRDSYTNLHYQLNQGNVAARRQQKIKDGLTALQAICENIIPDGLRKFATAFEKKFESRAIPLMVALDPELGIGYKQLEQTYQQSPLLDGINFPSAEPSSKHLQWTATHSMFVNKMVGGENLYQKGIVLTDSDLDHIGKGANNLPPGLSVLFRPLDDELFIESAGGATATALFGRFSIFDHDLGKTLKSIAHNEVYHNPNVVFAEINCLQELHTANVEHRISVYPYEIPLMTYPAITGEGLILLSDLWVSVNQGRIIMWSERLQKEVIPRLSSAYNYSRSHMHIYRFLCDLQYQGLQTNFTLDLSHYLPGLSFYLRVTYKGAILSLANWNIRLSDLTLAGDDDESTKAKVIREYLQQKSMCRHFALYNGDQQLVYDMDSDTDLLFMYSILETQELIGIKEFPFVLNENGMKDRKGRKYLTQYLTALLHQENVYRGDISEQLRAASLYDTPKETDEWVYFKVYCHPGNSSMILTQVIDTVYDGLILNGLIDRYFYVVYLDPGYHLRLRFRCTSYENKASVIMVLEEELLPYRNQGVISNISMDYYRKEYERYGVDNMELIEQIFDADTKWIMNTSKSKNDQHGSIMHTIVSVALLLEAFGLSLSEKTEQCSQIMDSLFTEFHGDRKMQSEMNTKFREYKATWDDQYASALYSTQVNQDYIAVSKLIRKLIKIRKKETEDRININTLCADVIHMHLNRIFLEQPREQEMIVYYLLLQHYKSVYFRELNSK